MKTNPWFKKYKTIFEQSNDYVNMCVLFLDVIHGLSIKITFHGFESMHVIDEVKN
jgi:hypothetical protein